MVWHIDHTDPRYVFVDVSTHLSSIQSWREAAVLDPKAMAWAQLVSVHELKPVHEHDDDAIATLRMTLAEYDSTLAGMDDHPEHVPSAIEALLDCIAYEILDDAEIDETVQSIPVLGNHDAAALHIVCWSQGQAAGIKTAFDDWPEAFLGFEMYRLSTSQSKVWLAVDLPTDAYARVIEVMDEESASFCDSVFSVLVGICHAEEAKLVSASPGCVTGRYSLDDDIPF